MANEQKMAQVHIIKCVIDLTGKCQKNKRCKYVSRQEKKTQMENERTKKEKKYIKKIVNGVS